MKILKVPYAEKDQAKALGARWNNERKVWYVPDGEQTAPFAKWIVAGQSDDAPALAKSAKPAKVDSTHGSSRGVGTRPYRSARSSRTSPGFVGYPGL